MKNILQKGVVFIGVITISCMFNASITKAEPDGKSIFESRCAKCHGTDGKVTKRGEALGARNFTDPEWQQSVSDGEIFNTITNGKNKMAGWKDKLSKEEIDVLVHYVRILLPRSLRNNMPKVLQEKHYK